MEKHRCKTIMALYAFLVICGITLLTTLLPAQTASHACGSDYVLRTIRKNPALAGAHEFNERLMYDATRSLSKSANRLMANEKYRIPVVVHVIHNNGDENIPNEQIFLGIKQLNDAFANRGFYDSTSGVSVNIEFCLAQQDPNGKLTNGITRTVSPLTDLLLEDQDAALKDLVRWDPLHYINIWLIRSLTSTTEGPGLVGYAYFPSSHGKSMDGIIMVSSWLATLPENTSVLVHEMGHYLGLYHTFEESCLNNDCLLQGDRVCDTPPDASKAAVQCNSSMNSCHTDEDDISANNPFRAVARGGLGDQNDMTNNYMDYSILRCASVFTPGQRDRMLLSLTTIRTSLLESKGCTTPCISSIKAAFLPSATTITVGNSVSFLNSSVGAEYFEWSINGTIVSLSSNLPPQTFSQKGSYTVTLKITGKDSNCVSYFSIPINVICTATASFTSNTDAVTLGRLVTFTSTSSGESSYEWYIDGKLVGKSATLQYRFNTLGGYKVYLITKNNLCSDTSAVMYIRAGDCSSRKETNVWYFGAGAGIRFVNGKAEPLSDGDFTTSIEGIATICDKDGKFLLHSDGISIWNKDHRVILLDKDLNDQGALLSTQAAIIIPQPDNPTRYYVFSTTDWNSKEKKSYYAVIDVAQNGGTGAAVQQPTLLHANVSERITAIYHANCKDVWILVHEMNNNRYVAYLLTASGLSAKPVFSDVGTIARGANRFGILRASPDSKHICSVLGGATDMPTIELLDFNPETGVLSNALPLTAPNVIPNAYSSEFSPDMSKLYVTADGTKFIYQFDLSSADSATIRSSMLSLNVSPEGKSSLQLGPDGVIYISKLKKANMDIILFPNAKGDDCGYTRSAIDLWGNTSGKGLPNFPSSYFLQRVSVHGPKKMCAGTSTTVFAQHVGCASSQQSWAVRGNVVISDSTADHITIMAKDTGRIHVVAMQQAECGMYSDSIEIAVGKPFSITLGEDKGICLAAPVPITLNAGDGYSSYIWSNGSTAKSITVTTKGKYWVEVGNNTTCTARDTIEIIEAQPGTPPHIGQDIPLCGDTVLRLDAGAGYRSYRWQNGSTRQTFTAYNTGIYYVTVTDDCGNTFGDTVIVRRAYPRTAPALGADLYFCSSTPVTFDAGEGYSSYRWQDGSAARQYHAYGNGVYHVTVHDSCGNAYSDTVAIHVAPLQGQLQVFASMDKPDIGKTVRLPLHATMGKAVPYPVTIPSAVIRVFFDKRVFIPDSVVGGTWSYSENGNTALVSINVKNVVLDSNNAAIGYLKGTLLLSSLKYAFHISIETDSCFRTQDTEEEIDVESGVCFYQGRLIQFTQETKLSVFPNPVDDNLGCSFSIPAVQGDVRISLISTDGKEYELFRHPLAEGKHTIEFNIQDIPSGIYICKLVAGTQVAEVSISVVH